MASAAMCDFDRILASRVTLQIKVRLYDICFKSIALYASETCTVTQTDSHRIDSFNQWLLRRICGVRWSDHITNVEILRRTSQQPLSKVVSRRHLTNCPRDSNGVPPRYVARSPSAGCRYHGSGKREGTAPHGNQL